MRAARVTAAVVCIAGDLFRHGVCVMQQSGEAFARHAIERTEQQLQQAGVEYVIFAEIEPNPLKSTVMRGGAFAREQGCDFIVALGGGSVMDASKAIATMATNDGDLWDYIHGGTGKGLPFPKAPLLPQRVQ